MDVLATWKRTCDVQAKMHERCRIVLRFRSLMLSLPAILLSTMSGIANLTNFNHLVSQDDDDRGLGAEILSTLSGMMSLLAAMLFALHRYFTLPELQREHMLFSNAYTRLGNEILLHMKLMGSKQRAFTTTDELLKDVKHRLDIIIEQSPPLLSRVVKRLARDDRIEVQEV